MIRKISHLLLKTAMVKKYGAEDSVTKRNSLKAVTAVMSQFL
ncbi:hypothetical protein [Eubacterium ruminantium]|nr:hypothetical protein [Eubacterium ruminantium]